jgi:hypothetical protein
MAAQPIPVGAVCGRDDPPEAMRAAFLEFGFVVFRGFLHAADAAEVLEQANSFAARLPLLLEQSQVPREHVQYDHIGRPTTLKQIQQVWRRTLTFDRFGPPAPTELDLLLPHLLQLHRHDAFFTSLTGSLTSIAVATLGEPCRLDNVQYFNKPPTSAYPDGEASRPTPPHQVHNPLLGDATSLAQQCRPSHSRLRLAGWVLLDA